MPPSGRVAYLSPRGSGQPRREARRPRAAAAGTDSARSSCKKWPSERRLCGQEGRGGAGARVLPWLHLAGLPSSGGAKRPSSAEATGRCARAAARPSCGEQRRRWQRPRRAGSRLPAPARALSHTRSETRLRRAAPTSGRGGALPPQDLPTPLFPSTVSRLPAASATPSGIQ